MKRIGCLLLAGVLTLGLLQGCQKTAEVTSATVQTAQTAQNAAHMETVDTVDAFLAAIAPGAVITLAPGTYDLTAAESYGQRTGNPYVKWVDAYDGYELKIHDIDNLTICGSGMGTTKIVTRPTNANVLLLEDCLNVFLSDFTAGHVTAAEGCSAGVIGLTGCEDTNLQKLGLYGCGSVGVSASGCKRTNITECDIYDCSFSGINLYNCNKTDILSTKVHDLGKLDQGWCMLSVSSCKQTTVDSCSFTDCETYYFLNASDSTGLRLTGCTVSGNSFVQAMFSLWSGDTTVDSKTVFSDNTFTRWYENADVTAFDEAGIAFHPEEPEKLHKEVVPATAEPVILTPAKKHAGAATADEFLAAIGSDTEIMLTADIDLSTAANYGKSGGTNYHWEDAYDGPKLVITGVDNMTIACEAVAGVTVSAVPRYADVLTFQNCNYIHIYNLTVGHTQEPGECIGGVLSFVNSTNLLVEECRLFGCGTLGVQADGVVGLQIINSKIYECTYGGISLQNTSNVTIGGCDFWDLGGATFRFWGCDNITVDGTAVNGDYYGD